MVTVIIVLIAILFAVAIVYALKHEEKVIEKAEKNIFYHTLAKLTSSKYVDYKPNEEEKKAMEEFISRDTEYDRHCIGGYFKLSSSLKDTLGTCGNFHNYSLNFEVGELAVGFATIAFFAVIVTLGVMFC